jgi:two-component system CheB/CheR fusion protein
LLRNVLDIVAGELREKSLNVTMELNAQRDDVRGDWARLQQVFWNLIKNAAKFSYFGGTITLRSWCAGAERIAIEIGDNGKGVDPEALPRIFDAFEQGESSMTRMFGGLGLGLTIAKSVVDLHGGKIAAASEGPGKGAQFTVTLPLSPAVAGDCRPASNREQKPVPDGARPARVLLVEDHADTARLLSRLLERKGHHVQWATSVATALEMASAEQFDVLVSDIGLPDATGYELMNKLRQRGKSEGAAMKGIAISGYGMDEDIRKSKESGFDEHFVKPLSLDVLDEAIQRLVGADGR